MAHIDRDGVKIYYEVHGDGPAVLLSHGYSATSRMWEAQARALSRDHQVVVWDMRGHGQSDYPEDPELYSEAHTVEDMAAILDAVGADNAVIGGLSLGGYMSLGFHLKYPERTRALMLFDTGPGYKKDEARAKWNASAEKTARRLEELGLGALGDSAERRAQEHRSPEGLIRAARGMLTQFDARVIESLPTVDVDTLVLVGADDTPFLGATDYMAGKIPRSRKIVIEDAGHAANLDQPEKFNAAVAGFLAGLPAL